MKKLKFVLSLTTLDNDYQVEQAVVAEETSRKLDIDLQILFADRDPFAQSQHLLDIILSHLEPHPDGIILEPVGGAALPQVAEAAAKAGIGWVILNREVGYLPELRKIYPTPSFCVTPDNRMIGRIQGNQLASLLPNGGSALYIQGLSHSGPASQRTEGMYETKAGIEVKLLRAQWTEESSYRAVGSWLQLCRYRGGHIDAIAAQNDAMAMGARRSFVELPESCRSQWLDLPYLGVDGVRKTGLAWVKQGLLRATVIVPPTAGQALEMLTQAVQKASMPPEMTTVVPLGYPSLEHLRAVRTPKKYVAVGPSQTDDAEQDASVAEKA